MRLPAPFVSLLVWRLQTACGMFLFLSLLCLCGFCGQLTEANGKLPPPRDVSIMWRNYFCLRLSWRPPEMNAPCSVTYQLEENINQKSRMFSRSVPVYETCPILDNGVSFIVKTKSSNCSSQPESEAVVLLDLPPHKVKLVKNFQCHCYLPTAINCSWELGNVTSDLQLYFWYEGLPEMEVCTYLSQTGCHMEGEFVRKAGALHPIYFALKDGSNHTNTFQTLPYHNIKPPPPVVRIQSDGSGLHLTWDPPEGFLSTCWMYQHRYKHGDAAEWVVSNDSQETSAVLFYSHHHHYSVQVRAIYKRSCGYGASDWSPEIPYGHTHRPDYSLYITIIVVPLLLALCTTFSILLYKKYQRVILPEVPSPKNMLMNPVNEGQIWKPQSPLTLEHECCDLVNVEDIQ